MRMIHTREGAHAVNLMLTHAGAKQRKAVLKALKGQVGRIVRDEHAAVAVMCMLDSVDDTQLLAKVIVAELRQEGLAGSSIPRVTHSFVHSLDVRGASPWCVHVACTRVIYTWHVHVACTRGMYTWHVHVVCKRGVWRARTLMVVRGLQQCRMNAGG